MFDLDPDELVASINNSYADPDKFTCYVFVLSFLSGAQKAVQSTHAVAELLNEYAGVRHDVQKWVSVDKRLILLDAGNYKSLQDLFIKFRSYDDRAVVSFSEDEETLGELMTAFAVVMPDNMWNDEEHCFDPRYHLIRRLPLLTT